VPRGRELDYARGGGGQGGSLDQGSLDQGSGGGPEGPAEPANEEDPCKGLCFSDEHCVVQAGVADCVRR